MFGHISLVLLMGCHFLMQCVAFEPSVHQSLNGKVERSMKRSIQGQDLNLVRLSSCNRGTITGLTVNHWKMLESKYKELGCWKSKVSKLFNLLYKEEKFGQHFEYPSGSQGYRLRCRLLFKFDLCRSNFIRVRASYHPDVSTDWPDQVLKTIAEHLDDGEDYGEDYYYNYGSHGNMNNNVAYEH